jgi:oxygen-dependent protoporphyrinogen oxidase
MLGGAMNPEIVTWSDEQILQIILKDRERLVGVATEPLQHHIQRWPRSIPHYTCAWESALKSLRVAPPLYLHGNYLGQIGLARILERSMTLAQNIRENYGE